MSVSSYDENLIEKLKSWTANTQINIYGPDESARLFEVTTLRFVPPPARSRCATPQMPAFALPPTPATRVRPAPGVLLVGRPQTNTRSQYFPPQRPIPGEARGPHYCHQVKHKDKQIHPSETIQAFYQLIYDSGIKL